MVQIQGLSQEQLSALPKEVRAVLERQEAANIAKDEALAKARLKLGKSADSLATFKVYDLPNRSGVWMHAGDKGGVVCVFKKNGSTISGGININLNVADLLKNASKEFTAALIDYLSEYGDELNKRANRAAAEKVKARRR